jgi:DNA-binding transcriptional LysR family regulator
MTFKQLEVFLAVADTRSFSKGGEMVSLAQSTASQHVRALEEELEARLFDRNVSQVCLTEAGQLFYEQAAEICRLCAKAKEDVRRFQGLEQATLRLGASTIPAVYLIPVLLGRFTKAWPGVRLEVAQGDSREIIRLVQENHVEFGVVGGRFSADNVSFQELLRDQIILVGHQQQQQDTAVSVQQLPEIPLIIREQGSGTRQALEDSLQKVGLQLRNLRIVAELGSTEAVLRAVLCGAGSAFVSKLAVRQELHNGTLIEQHVSDLEISRQIFLAKRRMGSLSPAAEAFLTLWRAGCD